MPATRGDTVGPVRRLPNWRQGAPWWALPFLLVGYLAVGVGLLVAMLTDWWTFQIVVLLTIGVGAAVTGHWYFALLSLLGAAAGIVGMRAESRRDRARQ